VLYDFPADKRTDVHVLTHHLVIMDTSDLHLPNRRPLMRFCLNPHSLSLCPWNHSYPNTKLSPENHSNWRNWIFPWQIPLNFRWNFFFRKE
jgi:hypothetical protein